MPEFNTRLSIEQSEASLTHSWIYNVVAPLGPEEENVDINVQAGTTADVASQLQALRFIVFNPEDRNGADAYSYLFPTITGNLNVRFTNPTQTDRWVQVGFKVLDVARRSVLFAQVLAQLAAGTTSAAIRIHGQPFRSRNRPDINADIYVYVDTSTAITYTESPAFTAANLGAGLGFGGIDGWWVTVDRPEVMEGFTLDTWGKLVGAESSVDFLGLDQADAGADTVELVLDVRYDARVATGQTCMIGSTNYRITRVVETVANRLLRLTLVRLIS